jgi:voltage-gated potassium channel
MESEVTNALPFSKRGNPSNRRLTTFAKWSAVEFLGALVLFIFTSPFVVDMPNGRVIEAVLLTLVLASAIVAVSQRRTTRVAAILLGLPSVAARWLHVYLPHLIPSTVPVCIGLVFLLFILFHYFRYILRAPTVNFTVLCAAVSTYLLLGVLWTMAYVLVDTMRPHSFALGGRAGIPFAMTPFDAFYFSFVTLNTLGYGDIVPVSRAARMLAVMEATTGMLYIATLIARLVAIHSSSRPNRPAQT